MCYDKIPVFPEVMQDFSRFLQKIREIKNFDSQSHQKENLNVAERRVQTSATFSLVKRQCSSRASANNPVMQIVSKLRAGAVPTAN